MGLKEFVVSLFQLDKDWTTRIVMAMLVMGVIWGLLGVIDSLMVRIQETMWGLSGTLVFTPQEYFASITLHAERDLFGFAQQVIYAIFIYFTIKLLNLQPRAKWLLNISFILINISMMFMEGRLSSLPLLTTTTSALPTGTTYLPWEFPTIPIMWYLPVLLRLASSGRLYLSSGDMDCLSLLYSVQAT